MFYLLAPRSGLWDDFLLSGNVALLQSACPVEDPGLHRQDCKQNKTIMDMSVN